jgi:hypothetical protein
MPAIVKTSTNKHADRVGVAVFVGLVHDDTSLYASSENRGSSRKKNHSPPPYIRLCDRQVILMFTIE